MSVTGIMNVGIEGGAVRGRGKSGPDHPGLRTPGVVPVLVVRVAAIPVRVSRVRVVSPPVVAVAVAIVPTIAVPIGLLAIVTPIWVVIPEQ